MIHFLLAAALTTSQAASQPVYVFPAFPDQHTCEEIAVRLAPRLASAREHGITKEEIDAMPWAPSVPQWYRALFDHWTASLYATDDAGEWFVSVVLRECREIT